MDASRPLDSSQRAGEICRRNTKCEGFIVKLSCRPGEKIRGERTCGARSRSEAEVIKSGLLQITQV